MILAMSYKKLDKLRIQVACLACGKTERSENKGFFFVSFLSM